MVSDNKLDKSFFNFVTVHATYLIMVTLPGIFISTFLLSQTGDFKTVLKYNMIMFIACALVMLLAAYVLNRFNSSLVMGIGIVFYVCTYLMLVYLGKDASAYYYILGILMGTADGFYWISYGNLLSASTNVRNRDKGIAISSIIASVVNLIVPLISGYIIVKVGGLKGYIYVFSLSFILAIITLIRAFRLKNPTKANDNVNYVLAVKLIKDNRAIKYSLLAQSCKGIREGIFLFILNILLYLLVKNEFIIGANAFFSAIASISSFVIISKKVNYQNRIKYMVGALTALIAYNVYAIFNITAMTMIGFTVVNAFFTGFILNSCYGQFLDSIHVVKESYKHKSELLAINEGVLVFGRCCGIVTMLVMNYFSNGAIFWQLVCLLLLTLSQFLTIFFASVGAKEILKLEGAK